MMNNEIEQKREYAAPQMEVVQFELQDRLLWASPTDRPSGPPQPQSEGEFCSPKCGITIIP